MTPHQIHILKITYEAQIASLNQKLQKLQKLSSKTSKKLYHMGAGHWTETPLPNPKATGIILVDEASQKD